MKSEQEEKSESPPTAAKSGSVKTENKGKGKGKGKEGKANDKGKGKEARASDDKGKGKEGQANDKGKGKEARASDDKGRGKEDKEGKGKVDKGVVWEGQEEQDERARLCREEHLERARMWRTMERGDLLFRLHLRVNDIRAALIGYNARIDAAIEGLDSLQYELQCHPELGDRDFS